MYDAAGSNNREEIEYVLVVMLSQSPDYGITEVYLQCGEFTRHGNTRMVILSCGLLSGVCLRLDESLN